MANFLDKETFSSLEEGAVVMAYFPETIFLLMEILPFIKDSITELPEFGLNIGENIAEVSEVFGRATGQQLVEGRNIIILFVSRAI